MGNIMKVDAEVTVVDTTNKKSHLILGIIAHVTILDTR